jgi:alpha-L-fucosidase 2
VTPGTPVSRNGIVFTWPKTEPGAPNVVLARGQAIHVSGEGDRLGFLLSGLQPVTGTGTIVYADGSQQEYEVTAASWGKRTPGRRSRSQRHTGTMRWCAGLPK